MFVGSYGFDPNLLNIIECSAETHSVGDVSCSSFKPLRCWLIGGLFKRNVRDHVATTLPWRHILEDIWFSIKYANACRCENLMAREDVEIAIQRLHIGTHMGNGLRTVDQYASTVTMSHLDHLSRWSNGPKGVGYLAE